MKTAAIFPILALCLCALTPAPAVGQEASGESLPLETIEQGWTTKTIDNVQNGSLGTMLERFDQTWPTWMAGCVRSTIAKGLTEEVLDEDTELTVVVDPRNGYAEVSDAGTDGGLLSACVWNRSNGHKLLAVAIGKSTDPFIEFVCFYDYNPQLKTLTPEPDILAGFRKWTPDAPYYYQLPKVGKALVIDDWGDGGHRRHTFTWDGMKPIYAMTEDCQEEWDASIAVNYSGSQPDIRNFVTALLSQDDLGEALGAMADCWQRYLNGKSLPKGCSFTVDTQNGYLRFDEDFESGKERMVIECCYWKYADGKRKLVALCIDFYLNGKPIAAQYSGITFYDYDNKTRTMQVAYAPDLGFEYDVPGGTDSVSHSLPREGKTIVCDIYMASGKIRKSLTWNGTRFVPSSH